MRRSGYTKDKEKMRPLSKEWWFWTVVPLAVCGAAIAAVWFSLSVLILVCQ